MKLSNEKVLSLIESRLISLLPEGVHGLEAKWKSIRLFIKSDYPKDPAPSPPKIEANPFPSKATSSYNSDPSTQQEPFLISLDDEATEKPKEKKAKKLLISELIADIGQRVSEEPFLQEKIEKNLVLLSEMFEKVLCEISDELLKLKNRLIDHFFSFSQAGNSFLENFADGMLNSDEEFLQELSNLTNEVYFGKEWKLESFNSELIEKEINGLVKKMQKNIEEIRRRVVVESLDYSGFEKYEEDFGKKVIPSLPGKAHHTKQKGIIAHPTADNMFYFLDQIGRVFEMKKSDEKFELFSQEKHQMLHSTSNGLEFSPSGNRHLIFHTNECKKLMVYFTNTTRMARDPDYQWDMLEYPKYVTVALFLNEEDILVGFNAKIVSLYRIGVPWKPLKVIDVFQSNCYDILEFEKGRNSEVLVVGRLSHISCIDIEKGESRWQVSKRQTGNFHCHCVFLPKKDLVLFAVSSYLIYFIDYEKGKDFQKVEIGRNLTSNMTMYRQLLAVNPRETCFIFQRNLEVFMIGLNYDKENKKVDLEFKGKVSLKYERVPGVVCFVNSMICQWEKGQIILGNNFGEFALVNLKEFENE